jgi:DNA invertase Pin-like site-specific DNA recombinase
MGEPTAVIYARVSDRKQADDDVSVPTQIELGHKRAAELGARVAKVFTDGGKSAFRESNRRTFESAIEYACAIGAKYFITWSSSRFARNKFEAVSFKRELARAAVDLIYLASDIDLKTDDGWLLDSMFEIVDEMQSRNTSKDTRRSMIRNARHGFWVGGIAPFGYQSIPAPDDPKRRKLVPLPEESLIVAEIFGRRAQGLGAKSLADDLNSRGITNRGRKWQKQTILHMLRSDVYVGRMIFNRRTRDRREWKPREEWIIVEDCHMPIVTQDQFSRVQSLLVDAGDRSSGSPKSRHPFTGLLRCPCGGSLQTETAKGGAYSYYRCRLAQQGSGCTSPRIPAPQLDADLTAAILDRVLSRDNLLDVASAIERERRTWSRDVANRRRELHAIIASRKKKNSALYDVLELHGKAAPNLADLTQRLRENSAAIKDAEAQLATLDSDQADAESIRDTDLDDLAEFFRAALADTSNAARAREFYRGFIDSIEVKDGVAEIRYDPARLLVAPEKVRSGVKWLPAHASLRTLRVVRVAVRRARVNRLRAVG